MARVKNEQVRKAILEAAARLFEEKGYIATTIGSIAKAAGTSQSNVYVYFSSKIEIAFAVFDPWMRAQVEALEARVIAEPHISARLRLMVRGLLEGIAGDASGQTLTLVQALATARPTDTYSPELLNWTMERIEAMMAACLPATTPPERHALVQALILAFDGVALRQNLRRTDLDAAQAVEAVLMLFSAISGRIAA